MVFLKKLFHLDIKISRLLVPLNSLLQAPASESNGDVSTHYNDLHVRGFLNVSHVHICRQLRTLKDIPKLSTNFQLLSIFQVPWH